MEPARLPGRARLLVAAIVGAGIVVLGARLPDVADWDRTDVLACAALLLATALAEQFNIPLVHRHETQNFALTDGVWAAGLLLVAPSVLSVAVAGGVLAGESLRRWAPHKIAFNAGQFLLAITAAQALFGALGHHDRASPQAWPAAILAMAAFFVLNSIALGAVIALAEQKRFLGVLGKPLSLDLLHWAGNVTLGILAAVVWTAEPAALPLLAVPLAMLYVAYRGWFRSMHQRDRMHELARRADTIAERGDLSTRIAEVPEAADEVASLAQTLNRMLDRLEAAFERERRLFSEASHELRTPITICRGHLEVLGAHADPDEVREAVTLVLDELDLMGRILGDLTTLAAAEEAEFVRPETVELERFVPELAERAAPLLNGRLLTGPIPRGASVRADPQRLTQALINLLDNAAVHARGDRPVHLRLLAEDGCWRFEVSDEGGGLPPGEEEALFRPFARGQTAAPGSGLGLAIVRRIAEAHGGSAGVLNRPGVGTTFWIRMPR